MTFGKRWRRCGTFDDARRPREPSPSTLTSQTKRPPDPTSPYHPSTSALPEPPSPAQAVIDDVIAAIRPAFDVGFWVPASLHPEIAPAEFRAFLKEHARNPPPDDDPNALQRSASTASNVPSGLGRKKSMLSRPYQPSENDSADEPVVPLRRNRSSIYSTNQNQGPQLTISDLQKLEELAEASGSDDPARLRNILRRSLSLNVSPLDLDPSDLGDEADQPLVVAPPGQFLRRTARTRIRKSGLPGDGGGHRFGERRRGPSGRSATSPILQRTSSDVSSSDHGDSLESAEPTPRARTFSEDGLHERPDSFSEEALIYDAYARDEEEDSPPVLPPVLITESPPATDLEFADVSPPPQLDIPLPLEPALVEAPDPVIHQPQPTRLLTPGPADPYQPSPQTLSPRSPSRTPSPDTSLPNGSLANSPPSSSFLSTSPSPRKEKDKKGLFGKWGGDKEKDGKPGKGSKKERDRLEKERREKEQREKDSGFFGSLFGSKKKHDPSVPEPSSLHGGREAAQALLGQSQRAPKSPGPPSPMAPGGVGMMGGAGGINNYSRYPIHVERAIYRLSHIKLANPRRPLYEQVLISNLMFWYLGVINKAQAGAEAAAQAATAQAGGAVNGQGPAVGQPAEGEKEKAERERVEREAAAAAAAAAEKERVERVERERVERERAEREQWEREMEMKKREASPRRGALTKAAPAGGPQQRRAEMPVKGPQYEMQHRVMEKEYAGYNGNIPVRANTSPGPVAVGVTPGQASPRVQQSPTSPKFNQQQQPNQGQEHYYYSPGEAMQQRLPPGAMPPVDQSTWLVGSPPRKHANSSPPPMHVAPPHRRSRSPPPPGMNHAGIHQQQAIPVYNPDGGHSGARLGGRSLSATAVPSPSPPPPVMNGKIRKGQSAYASGAPTNGRRPREGEEEDVPLAVWQRQQRR
ncbi:hypothetical protein B0H11DRAFT_2221866 [Mycena galericulata]|nr:hypothetical protein B0H11DRAFT_2221866 [Mycena galericulata]